jgi:hypothetical protein
MSKLTNQRNSNEARTIRKVPSSLPSPSMTKHSSFALFIATCIALSCGPHTAHAEQPRDWIIAYQPGGTYLYTDWLGLGFQAQLEHRLPFFQGANELDLRVNVEPSLFYYESQADVDVRILVLTLGASVGFRDNFFNIAFKPGEDVGYQGRRHAVTHNSVNGFGEGRATLGLPFNDYVALISQFGARFEGGTDRTFDWRLGIVRDSGIFLHSDTALMFHNRTLGGIGPQVQVLRYDLDGHRNTQVNFGFVYAGRVGIRRRYDAVLLSVLFGLTGDINGVPTSQIYGDHYLKWPVVIQFGYRIQWELQGPKKPSEEPLP